MSLSTSKSSFLAHGHSEPEYAAFALCAFDANISMASLYYSFAYSQPVSATKFFARVILDLLEAIEDGLRGNRAWERRLLAGFSSLGHRNRLEAGAPAVSLFSRADSLNQKQLP